MTIFVRFVAPDKGKIKQASLSPEVLDAIQQKVPTPVTVAAVDELLD